MGVTPIPLPPPYGGVNELVPVVALESPDAENLLNFNTTRAGVVLRYGDSKYATRAISAGSTTNNGLAAYGDTKLFALITNISTTKIDFWDVDAGSIAHSTAAYAGTGVFSSSTYFNKYLFCFSNDANLTPGIYYNGSAFGTIGYTGSGFTPVGGGNAYRNRHYIIQSGEAAFWYSNIEAISGALTKVDLSSIASDKCTLVNISTVTLTDNIGSTDLLQTFIFSNGEILFYTGSYPNSPDWRIVGRAKIAQPISYYDSAFQYQGDTLVMCDTGLVSLRDLFLKGSQNASLLSVSAKIEKTWQRLIKLQRAAVPVLTGPVDASIKGIWDEGSKRIIISFPFYELNGAIAAGNYFFVFNAELQTWDFHQSTGFFGLPTGDIVKYKNKVVFTVPPSGATTAIVYEKEGATNFTDRNYLDASDIPYTFEVKSAPITNGRAFVQSCEGLEPFIESDLYAETEYRLIADLGASTSSAQKVLSRTSTLDKTFVNLGIEGSYIQYKISGTTTSGKTIGLKLYGINFHQQSGSNTR